MSDTQNATNQLDLPPAGDATQSSSPAAAEKAAAEKAAAEKAAAEKAAAEKAAAEKAAAEKPKKRPRRGPPADGAPEPRVTVLMTTSRLSDVEGTPLRRGQAVSVPERRLEALIAQGKVRQGSAGEIEAAKRRAPLGQLG